jgi:uncharacterized protein
MGRAVRALLIVLALALAGAAAPALVQAAPKFPALTGRVVDDANVLSPQTKAQLTDKLAALEQQTGRQLVVATLPSLQGLPIEDFGYQLGRAWGIGEKDKNNGAILLVAPAEHKVRIEVGYGLEPVLTDALSSVILQGRVLPKFRDGQIEAGVVEGANAIIDQLSLPDDQAKARVAKAVETPKRSPGGMPGFAVLIIMVVVFFMISGLFRRGGRGGGGLGSALPWILLGALNSRGGGWSGGGGGGFSGGGGGFSGGGGSFGGGGSSGSW